MVDADRISIACEWLLQISVDSLHKGIGLLKKALGIAQKHMDSFNSVFIVDHDRILIAPQYNTRYALHSSTPSLTGAVTDSQFPCDLHIYSLGRISTMKAEMNGNNSTWLH